MSEPDTGPLLEALHQRAEHWRWFFDEFWEYDAIVKYIEDDVRIAIEIYGPQPVIQFSCTVRLQIKGGERWEVLVTQSGAVNIRNPVEPEGLEE